jgi:hypothetical protein
MRGATLQFGMAPARQKASFIVSRLYFQGRNAWEPCNFG